MKHSLALSFPPDYTTQGWSRLKEKFSSLPGRTVLGTATEGITLHSCKLFLFHLTSPADGLATLHAFPSLHCNSSHQKYVFQTFNLWMLSKTWPNQQDLRGWFELNTLHGPSCRKQSCSQLNINGLSTGACAWPQLGYSTKSVLGTSPAAFSIAALGLAVSHLCILVLYCTLNPSSKETVDGSSVFNLNEWGIAWCELGTCFPQLNMCLCCMDLGGTCLSIRWNYTLPRNLLLQRIREKLRHGGGGADRLVWQLIKQWNILCVCLSF